MRSTEHILLVRPSRFIFNKQTATSNAFQQRAAADTEVISSTATGEFDLFARKLKEAGVNVIVFEDTEYPVKPDAVFPNNWVSFHSDGTVILYPMFAPNRRTERRMDIIEKLREQFYIKTVIDLSRHEAEGRFLEGTGSIIFDHENQVAYACLSPRTDLGLFKEVAALLNYTPVHFNAYDRGGQAIYHTNVMMCVAAKFALICMESIPDNTERDRLSGSLARSGHFIIDISIAQMNSFAGNMLMVRNARNEDILVMSQSAYETLTADQKEKITAHCSILPMPIKTIESIGGGSARCMMAEIFLPLKGEKD